MEEFDVKTSLSHAGAYLATHASQKFTDIAYHVVYLGVIDPAESESALSWAYSLSFCIFFPKTFSKSSKLMGRIVSQIRSCDPTGC